MPRQDDRVVFVREDWDLRTLDRRVAAMRRADPERSFALRAKGSGARKLLEKWSGRTLRAEQPGQVIELTITGSKGFGYYPPPGDTAKVILASEDLPVRGRIGSAPAPPD